MVGGLVALVMIWLVVMIGRSGDIAEVEAITTERRIPTQVPPRSEHVNDSSESASDPENCLSEGLLETHPMMMEEVKRLDPFLVNSESMAVYRGLEGPQLLSLVDQNDSGAMAVLGAMHVMRARGLPPSNAVSYLLLEDLDLHTYRFSRPLSEEHSNHLTMAADCFYRSALNGRVMALINVGEQLDLLGKKPVDLGWISAEDYDQLTRAEKSLFNAANVYQGVAYTIAPELELGLFGESGGGGTMFAQRYAEIAEPIADQFRVDRRELGLEPLTVPESELASLEELQDLLCNPPVE